MHKLKIIIKWLAVSIVFFGSFLYAAVFNTNSGWFIWYLSVLTLLFLLFLALLPLRRIQANIIGQAVFNRQTKEKLLVQLKSPPFFIYPLIEISLLTNHRSTPRFSLWRAKKVYFDLTDLPRGVYSQPILKVTSYDFLGLFNKKKQIRLLDQLIILPNENIKLAQLLEQQLFFKNVAVQARGDKSFDLKNVRAYESRDPLHEIDWKMSAHQQELVVKVFENEPKKEITILLVAKESPNFEHLLSGYFSLHQRLQHSFQRLNQPKQFIIAGNTIRSAVKIPDEIFANILATENPNLPTISGQQVYIFVEKKAFLEETWLKVLQKNNQVTLITLDKSQWSMTINQRVTTINSGVLTND
ncbi:DUF58 domain-containing protein [Enterococcus timonensis]|uniref:DUF58 domain-containing protein n=1 Tax=Enterococcus timonensis TaxID=1852364 RepID=UPI0008DA3871|nr:DUF58 domain-containing protein [Enterococcus timonensis]